MKRLGIWLWNWITTIIGIAIFILGACFTRSMWETPPDDSEGGDLG